MPPFLFCKCGGRRWGEKIALEWWSNRGSPPWWQKYMYRVPRICVPTQFSVFKVGGHILQGKDWHILFGKKCTRPCRVCHPCTCQLYTQWDLQYPHSLFRRLTLNSICHSSGFHEWRPIFPIEMSTLQEIVNANIIWGYVWVFVSGSVVTIVTAWTSFIILN